MFSPQESSIVENSKQTATVVPTVSTVLPIVKARSVPEYYEMPQITDDRFSNQRSWYKSLDVEVCKDYIVLHALIVLHQTCDLMFTFLKDWRVLKQHPSESFKIIFCHSRQYIIE